MQFWVLERLADVWAQTYSIRVNFELKFACENNTDKQAWLQQQHTELKVIFADMQDLKSTRAMNVITGLMTLVPRVDVFIVGPTCVDRSRLNVGRAANMGCVQRAAGKTGESFRQTFDYIESCEPACVILENVADLQQEPKGGGVSDAAFVEQRLREMKYQGTWHQNKADQYGSQAARERIYLFAHRGHRADIPQQAALVTGSIKIERLPWTSFWPEEWWTVRTLRFATSAWRPSGTCRSPTHRSCLPSAQSSSRC